MAVIARPGNIVGRPECLPAPIWGQCVGLAWCAAQAHMQHISPRGLVDVAGGEAHHRAPDVKTVRRVGRLEPQERRRSTVTWDACSSHK